MENLNSNPDATKYEDDDAGDSQHQGFLFDGSEQSHEYERGNKEKVDPGHDGTIGSGDQDNGANGVKDQINNGPDDAGRHNVAGTGHIAG